MNISETDKEFYKKFKINCVTTCPYFPNMDVHEGEWEEKGGIKKRKQPKIFRCLYDNHILNWFVTCPKDLVDSCKGEK